MAVVSEYIVLVVVALLMKSASSEIVTEPVVELRWDFTSCGSTGRFGPSQEFCDNAYSGTNLESDVLVKSGIQKWEVPTTGLYLITARSPSGSADSSRKAGRGAALTGEFRLTKGDTLYILVGQHGGIEEEILNNKATGGSGGTFVIVHHANNDDSILLIAGGASCGSGENWNVGNTITDANLFSHGNNASTIRDDNGVGGSNGGGGNAGDLIFGADSAAGGGAGYIGDGTTAPLKRSLFTEVGNPRPARPFGSSGFLDKGPGVGGYFMYLDGQRIVESNGGFGGGGSGSRNGGCGGGGGFSGGGGGSMNGWGGGGGSINNGQKQRNYHSTIDVGAVTISFIGHQCCGPVAVYIALTFLAGILVTLLIGYSIKRIVNSLNPNDENETNMCGRCWRKLWQMKSKNEPATPKRKS